MSLRYSPGIASYTKALIDLFSLNIPKLSLKSRVTLSDISLDLPIFTLVTKDEIIYPEYSAR